MKILFIMILINTGLVFAEEGLKLLEKQDYFERYKIESINFFRGKNFTYYTYNRAGDRSVTCYKLKINENLNFEFTQENNMNMKGKISIENNVISLTGKATMLGNIENEKPVKFELEEDYHVSKPGVKSPYFLNGNGSLSINLKELKGGDFQFLVYKCESDPTCRKSCK